jgi:LCP family protein required for cell wall assembly
MSKRTRSILVLAALFALTATVWSTFGGFTVASAQKTGVISRAHRGERSPTFDETLYLLMLGGDARTGNPQRARTDAIQILAVNPKTLRASILGIPRDSFVNIPGQGQRKINEATFHGGPELMIKTVENISGCRFDYYTMVNFQGFVRAIDAFGGVSVDVERRMFESCCSKINLFPGVQTLNGTKALAYARNRHVGRPRGDFDRSVAQGTLMVGALTKAREDYKKDVSTPLRALAALRRNIAMNISIAEAFKLGMLAMRIDPKNVHHDVVDGAPAAGPGGQSIVEISSRGKAQLLDICSKGDFDS